MKFTGKIKAKARDRGIGSQVYEPGGVHVFDTVTDLAFAYSIGRNTKEGSVKTKNRAAAVTGFVAVLLLTLTPQAQAAVEGEWMWTSKIVSGPVNFESHRWDDQSYSQIDFDDCHISYSVPTTDSVDVQMWQDVPFSPDDSYDNKTFTACFNTFSNGEWTDLPTSTNSMYFQLMKIGGKTFGPEIDVHWLGVDTTKAD